MESEVKWRLNPTELLVGAAFALLVASLLAGLSTLSLMLLGVLAFAGPPKWLLAMVLGALWLLVFAGLSAVARYVFSRARGAL